MTPSLDSLTRREPETKSARKFPAWLVPLALVAGFALLFLALFRDRLLPAPAVTTGLVLATESDAPPAGVSSAGGQLLFQASGWIEPDPTLIKATALVDGVVETAHVLEGQLVKKGDLLATLVDVDAKLALSAAEQNRQMLESGREAHLAAITTARKKIEGATAQRLAARTLEDEAADRYRRVKDLKGAVSASDVVTAKLRLEREQSMLLSATATAEELESEVLSMEHETRAKENGIAAAAVAVEQAKLALERTRILAPVEGRILRLTAAPGQKKMLLMDDVDSSTIAILYEPAKLQVRVDVPLADAAGLSLGQKARIRCSLMPDKVFDGEVTRLTGEADVQRNTLQAKVRIAQPLDQLRPEMLCRVEFLGTATTAGAAGTLAAWAPRNALTDGAVWVVDPETKRVSKRAVEVSSETREDKVRITTGLRPGEQVILSPQGLREGQRVKPTPR